MNNPTKVHQAPANQAPPYPLRKDDKPRAVWPEGCIHLNLGCSGCRDREQCAERRSCQRGVAQ